MSTPLKGLAQRNTAGGFGGHPNPGGPPPPFSSATASVGGRRAVRGGLPSPTSQNVLLAACGLLIVIWIILTATRVETRSSSSSYHEPKGSRLLPLSDDDDNGRQKNGLFGETVVDVPVSGRKGSDAKLAALLRDGAASAATTSLYCDPSVHHNQKDMRELAHRSFTIPLDETSPAVVQPVVVEERLHESFQKSLDQLARERVHDWHYVLEGAQTTPEGESLPNLMSRPFSSLDAGFYCLSVRDEVDNCIVASIPFSVLDKGREDSEYAVAPVRLAARTTLYGTIAKAAQAVAAAAPSAADAADRQQRSTMFRLKDVTLMYSKYFPLRSVCPVVIEIPSVLDAFYRQKDFSSHHDEFLHDSVTVAQRHVAISGGPAGGGHSAKIDVEYGRGSFWLVPGETYSHLRAALAKKDRRFLDALRLQKQSPSEVVKRATFEHYASQRSILLSPNPDEDEFISSGGDGDDLNRGNRNNDHNRRSEHLKRNKRMHQLEQELLNAAGRQLLSVKELRDDVGAEVNPTTQAPPKPLEDFVDPHLEDAEHRGAYQGDGGAATRKPAKKPKRRVRDANGKGGDGDVDEPHRHQQHQPSVRPQDFHGGERRHHRATTQLINYTVPFLVDDLHVHGVPDELMLAPKDFNQLLTLLHNLGKDQPCVMHISWTLHIREPVRIERSCVFVFAGDRPQMILEKGADVVLAGDGPTQPILLTSADAASLWGGIVVESGASLRLQHVMIHLVGRNNIPRVAGTGSHIKSQSPAVTLSPVTSSTAKSPATLVMEDSAILNCDGSGFALGKGSRASIFRTLVQDVAQGGECVSCHINISRSHFMDFPFVSNLSLAFVDGDNDAFYFRGGHAIVTDTVFLNALDDGIDSASTTGDADHTTLALNHVAIENCQHEGVALSGSKGTQRTVSIENSLITVTQQAVENGHTPVKHRALLRNTVLYRNHIGLRNGDNYPTLDVFGKVRAEHCLLIANSLPVLDWVEIDHSKRTSRNTYFDPKKYQYEVHNPLGDHHESAAADVMLPLLTLSGCLIDQQSPTSLERGGGGAVASIGALQSPPIDDRFYKSGLIVPSGVVANKGDDPALHQQHENAAHHNAQKDVRHGATRRYSSADLGKGLFCGRAHFVVDGAITTNQDPWRS